MTNYAQDANCQAAWLMTEGAGESVADDSPNTNTGTFKDTNEPQWAVMAGVNAPAYSNYMLDFVDDYVDFGNDSSLFFAGANAMTAWVNFDAFPTDNASGWMCVYDSGALFAAAGGLERSMGFYSSSGTQRIQIVFGRNNPGGDFVNMTVDDTETGITDTGTFYHVAMTWDGSTDADKAILYVGGVSKATYTATITTLNQDQDNSSKIGREAGGGSTYDINGKLGEQAHFDRNLTSVEVNDIMDNGLSPATNEIATDFTGVSP